MTFTMTSSNDGKNDICQFFYQDLFHIVNTVYVQNLMQNGQKLRYSMFLHREPTSRPCLSTLPPSPEIFKNLALVGLICLATCETTSIYQFITNNHASFRLWWEETLLNNENVSKYYVFDCSLTWPSIWRYTFCRSFRIRG